MLTLLFYFHCAWAYENWCLREFQDSTSSDVCAEKVCQLVFDGHGLQVYEVNSNKGDE